MVVQELGSVTLLQSTAHKSDLVELAEEGTANYLPAGLVLADEGLGRRLGELELGVHCAQADGLVVCGLFDRASCEAEDWQYWQLRVGPHNLSSFWILLSCQARISRQPLSLNQCSTSGQSQLLSRRPPYIVYPDLRFP